MSCGNPNFSTASYTGSCGCGPARPVASNPQGAPLGCGVGSAQATGCTLAVPQIPRACCQPSPFVSNPNSGSKYFTLNAAYGQ